MHDLFSETEKEDLRDQSLYASEPKAEEIDFAEAVGASLLPGTSCKYVQVDKTFAILCFHVSVILRAGSQTELSLCKPDVRQFCQNVSKPTIFYLAKVQTETEPCYARTVIKLERNKKELNGMLCDVASCIQ